MPLCWPRSSCRASQNPRKSSLPKPEPTASRPGQLAALTNGRRVLAESSVKGDTGSRTRNRAQRVPKRARMAGKTEPLMLVEAREPIGKGKGQRAKPATPAPAASRARTDAGCNPKRVAQAKRGEFPTGDRLARSRQTAYKVDQQGNVTYYDQQKRVMFTDRGEAPWNSASRRRSPTTAEGTNPCRTLMSE